MGVLGVLDDYLVSTLLAILIVTLQLYLAAASSQFSEGSKLLLISEFSLFPLPVMNALCLFSWPTSTHSSGLNVIPLWKLPDPLCPHRFLIK